MIQKLVEYIPSNNRVERIWKLAQVDFQSRYYNDRLGLLWALIKPIFEATLYYIAFKYLLLIDKQDFGLFLFGGIITWMVFSEGTSRSITLLQNKSYLIENVQFNHIDLYYAHTSSALFGFIFNLSAFAFLSLILGHNANWQIIYLPVILITIFVLVMAFSQILSTLQPFVKDITHFWDMSILAGFWVSGIFFEPQIIFDKLPWFAHVNPFIGIIMNIRGIFINNYDISLYWMLHNLIFAFIFAFIGNIIFKKYSVLAFEKL